MKTIILTLVFSFLVLAGFCTEDKYTEAMKKNIALMDSAKTFDEYQNLANQFERISIAEKEKWQPAYYAAMCQIFMGYNDQNKDNIDKYLDKAQTFIDIALKLNDKESEIVVMQAWIHQARIQVDPMSRGQKFSELAGAEFEKAKVLNENNPRIYYLQGMNTFHTPKFFGGGAKNAKPIFEIAKQKYDMFVPENELSPKWGKKANEKMIEMCKAD